MNEMNTIKCQNCGAEYDANLVRCPSCDYENKVKAYKDYSDKISEINKERDDIEQIPDRVVKKSRVGIVILVAAAAIVFIAGIVLLFTVILTNKKSSIKDEKENMKLFESYLADNNYEMLVSEMERYDIDDSSISSPYYKYTEVKNAYNSYLRMVSDADNFLNNNYSYLLYDYYILYRNTDVNINDSRMFGNEDNLRDILNMGSDFVCGKCNISKTNLDQMMIDASEAEIGWDYTFFEQRYEEYVGE